MTSNLDEFSDGYYSLQMRVSPYEDGPVVEQQLYDFIVENVYNNTNAPVWMRYGFEESPYFIVEGEPGIPHDVIAIPEDWMQEFEISDEFKREQFLVCKSDFAYILSQSSSPVPSFNDIQDAKETREE